MQGFSTRPLLGALMATAFTATLAAALPAAAQTMRPGLWETSSMISSADPQTQAGLSQMQKRLADMSPAQRKQMEQMLKRNGVQLDLSNSGALRTQVCLTREMIERKEWPVQQGQCTQQATQLAPNHVKVNFTCTKPAASGEGDVTVDDETHYHGKVNANMGNGQNAQAAVTGTWLAADCGSVRPAVAPQTKPK